MLSLDDIVQPGVGAVSNAAGEELVVVLPERARFLVLNSTGAQVWHLADGHRSLGEIAQKLAETWGIDVARAQADVLQIAGQLIERNVLVQGDDGSLASGADPSQG